MTVEFQRAVDRVTADVLIDGGAGADLVAAGVQRDDCLEFLHDMLAGEHGITAELLSTIVQLAVVIGVQLERARWQ